jgi:RNA polymerase sigma factor (sigma-70 family)
MNEQTDPQLLRAYAEHRAEAAFAELVHRHLDFVYSAAIRMVCDAHLAQDVTQAVFVALAQNATHLADRPVLSGWLHRTARNIAAQTVRTIERRRAREQEAAAMNELLSPESEAAWQQIAPHLDAALDELSEPDRDAVLLRYFEKKSAPEMAILLGITDDAAQKRVRRAVERLREFFAKRGVTVGASGLAITVSAHAIQAAPAGLAITISTAAALAKTTIATTATVAVAKTIAMTTLQKTAIAATIAILTGAGIYEARQASQLRAQVQTLQQQQTLLAERNQQLESESAEKSVQLAQMNDHKSPTNNSNELLRLRGAVAKLHRENIEANTPITQEAVTTRYKDAQELARNGDAAGALREFLWCYDEGMTRFPSFAGVRSSYLLNSIAKLGETYPPALTALRERRDQAMRQLLNNENDSTAALDFTTLNRALNDGQNTLAVLDQLPVEDSRHKSLAYMAYEQLVEAQRYNEAVSGRSYANINMLFEMGKMDIPTPANVSNPERIQKSRRDSLIKSAARDVEALAGAGDLTNARTLAERLLAYDNSPETKALLQQHIARAGQAGLLDNAPNP